MEGGAPSLDLAALGLHSMHSIRILIMSPETKTMPKTANLLNKIQVFRPTTLTPDHGVSQLTHPDHADKAKLFCATMLILMIIMRRQKERGLHVCYTCYHDYELENLNGPCAAVTVNRFKRHCRHYRCCYNAQCNPRDT